MALIGRAAERAKIDEMLKSGKAEFVAVYGRRRVGKTFLITEYFNNMFSFQASGLSEGTMHAQLGVFDDKLREYGLARPARSKTWFEAFQSLKELLRSDGVARHGASGRRVVFIDEMPWFDTPKSQFRSALEYFWNDWGSKQKDLVLIVCGSATSWIVDKLLESKGGFYDRVTRIIDLQPFTLGECAEFYHEKGIVYTDRQIVECYMVFGGIPFYLDLLSTGKSLAQSIDGLCFSRNGHLRNEFDRMYSSLFKHPEAHMRVVRALARRKTGLTASDFRKHEKLVGSGLTKTLKELEQCGLIRRYRDFTRPKSNALYQLIDPFTLFHLEFIDSEKVGSWTGYYGTPGYHAWSGLAFELVCLHHMDGIKREIGISGVETKACSWRSRSSAPGAQIDLLIDRRDDVINICEMKFSRGAYVVTQDDERRLRAKIDIFEREAKPRKALHLTMVTMEGCARNAHYDAVVHSEVRMEDVIRTRP